jgi:hypothetical protein
MDYEIPFYRKHTQRQRRGATRRRLSRKDIWPWTAA